MGKKTGTKPPKRECCVSSTKCGRCPLRMLKEGTLPAGYTVKKRRLMVTDTKGVLVPVTKAAQRAQQQLAQEPKQSGKAKKKAGSKKKLAAAA